MSDLIKPYKPGMTIDRPCAVADMPDDFYHADPCPTPSLSGTTAFKMVQPGGPALVKEDKGHPEKPKPTMIEGTAAHAIVLGAGKQLIADEYITDAGRQSTKKEAKEWRAAQQAAGFQVVVPELLERANAMKQAIKAHPEAGPLLEGGIPELSIFYHDDVNGVWLRGRIDYLRDRKTVIDYKTTTLHGAEPRQVNRAIPDRGYHIQAAHYMHIAKRLGIIDDDATYHLIVQERQAPYRIATIELTPLTLGTGEKERQQAVELWKTCNTTDEWPSLPTETRKFDLPIWYKPELQEQVLEELNSAEQAAKEFDELIKENKAA